MKKKVNMNSMLALAVICLVILALWNTPVIYPVKIFVVLLHELSHGLAALVTGGSIEKIVINADQGGVCYTRGGSMLFILAAGYLGSMVWGSLILVLAARTRIDRILSAVIGLMVFGVTVIYIRNVWGLVFGIVFGIALLLVAIFASMEINDFILKVIGLASIMYVITDIKDDLISRNIPSSDASRFGELLFGNSIFWGIVWIIIALVVAFFALRIAAKE
jgi:hypothetical protein